MHAPLHPPRTAASFQRAACSLRVLLAEDNLTTQQVAASLLTTRGHVVTMVSNGRDAIEAWRREPFDVILMDVQMPEMDGLQATAEIRQLEASLGRRTPIVAMTARVLVGDREQCLAAGMDAYVSKPISPAALFVTMEPLATADTSPVDRTSGVDMSELLAIVGGDRRVLDQIIDVFLDDAQAQITRITRAIGAKDALELRASAHALKGAAGSVRVTYVADVAAKLEQAARAGDLGAADDLLTELHLAFDRAQGTLDPMMRAG